MLSASQEGFDMQDDQDAKAKQANPPATGQTTVISSEQAASGIRADQFTQSVGSPGKSVEGSPRQALAKPRIRRGTVPTVNFRSGTAAPLEGKALVELVSRGLGFREAKQKSANRHPQIEEFTVILLESSKSVADGFIKNNDESLFVDILDDFYQNSEDSVKFAIKNKSLYLGIVEKNKGIIFSLLKDNYGFNQPEATKLAVLFDSLAKAAMDGNIDAVVASIGLGEEDRLVTSPDAPDMVTARFADRPDKAQSPLEFLELHYGRWLRGNGLYQHTLRKLDKSLMQHLDRRFVGRRDELAKIIPNKRAEIDARLGPDAERLTPRERKRALDALRMKI